MLKPVRCFASVMALLVLTGGVAVAADAQSETTAQATVTEVISAEPPVESVAMDTVAIEARTVPVLLRDLAQASLNETPAIVDALASSGGLSMLPLFQAMLAGELYYERETLRILRIAENEAGDDVASDVLTDADLGPVNARDYRKVRINNRVRGQLRDAIARINLTEGSAQQRRAAATAMLDDIDDSTVAAFEQALKTETDAQVRDVIEVGIAMAVLKSAATQSEQLVALERLDGRLEAPVRNLLTSIAESSGDARPTAVQRQAAAIVSGINARIEHYQFVEQLFFGLSLGSVLLLAAIGLAVTFGVMGVINMAHGEMLMLGAYTTYVIQQLMPQSINLSIWVAIPSAFIVAALFGMLIQRFVIRYLAGRPLETLLATFGISLILQQSVRTIFSPLNRRVISPDWMSGSWQINPVLSLTNNRLYILAFSLIVFFILLLILKRTSLGLNVRAVSQNRDMARAMGIRTDIVDAMTFGLGSGIAGIAGVALSQLTNVGPNLGQQYIIDSFMVVVFGGVGNLFGTLLAAFSLGVANKFLEPVTGAVLANTFILIFIILFIQKRPKGLFPQKGRAAE